MKAQEVTVKLIS